MNEEDLIFWIIVGIVVAFIFILFSNKLLLNMLRVSIGFNP